MLLSSGLYGKLTVIRRTGEDGRDSESDIRLRVVEVSRLHCKISFDSETKQAVIYDLSSNGTLVNDEQVPGNQKLENGDIIAIGERCFRFEYADPLSAKKLEQIQAKARVLGSPSPTRKDCLPRSSQESETPKKRIKKMETPIKRTLFKDMIASKFNKAWEQSPGTQAQSKSTELPLPNELEIINGDQDEPIVSLPVVQASPGQHEKSSPAKGNRDILLIKKVSTPSDSFANEPKSRQKFANRNNYPSSLPRPTAVKKEKPMRMTCSNQNTPRTTIPVEKQAPSSDIQGDIVLSNSASIIEKSTPTSRTPASSSASKRRATEEIKKSNKVIKVAPLDIVEQPYESSNAPEDTFLNMNKDAFFEEMKQFVNLSKGSAHSPINVKRRASLATTKQKVGSPSRCHSTGKIKNAAMKPTVSSHQMMIRRNVTFGPALGPEVFDKFQPPSSPLLRGEHAPSSNGSLEGTPAQDKSLRSILKSSVISSSASGSAKKAQPTSVNEIAEMQTGHQSPAPKPTLMSDEVYLTKALNLIVKSKTPNGTSSKKHMVSPFMISASSPMQKNRQVPAPKPSRFELPALTAKSPEMNDDSPPEAENEEIESSHEESKHVDDELNGISENVACLDEQPSVPVVSQNYVGIKELLKTPKCTQNTTHLDGITELFQSPDLVDPALTNSNLVGTKDAKEISYVGLRELVHTPKTIAQISLLGVRELVKTPKASKSPEVNFEPVLFDDANEEVIVVKKRPGRPKRGHTFEITVDSDVPEPAEVPKIAQVSEIVEEFAKEIPDMEALATTEASLPKSIPTTSFYGATPAKPRVTRSRKVKPVEDQENEEPIKSQSKRSSKKSEESKAPVSRRSARTSKNDQGQVDSVEPIEGSQSLKKRKPAPVPEEPLEKKPKASVTKETKRSSRKQSAEEKKTRASTLKESNASEPTTRRSLRSRG